MDHQLTLYPSYSSPVAVATKYNVYESDVIIDRRPCPAPMRVVALNCQCTKSRDIHRAENGSNSEDED